MQVGPCMSLAGAIPIGLDDHLSERKTKGRIYRDREHEMVVCWGALTASGSTFPECVSV